jgi:hypothetical protein
VQRQTVFLLDHHVDPALAILGDRFYHALQRLAVEALGFEDGADLVALALRHLIDVTFFLAPQPVARIALALDRLVVAHRHGEAVRHHVRGAEDEGDDTGQAGAGHAGDEPVSGPVRRVRVLTEKPRSRTMESMSVFSASTLPSILPSPSARA